ncbi:MAG: TetR family transcriptional regulator [Aestuariibacter sp.]
MTEFKRARGAKEKEIRRKSILTSAIKLYQQNPAALPTTSMIGKDAGVAKGTLYLYFRSKEEIFLAVLEELHLKWLQTFHRSGEFDESIMLMLIDNSCGFIEETPLFMQLGAMSASVIEQNVDSKILLTHKNTLAKAMKSAAQSLSKLVGSLSDEDAAALIIRSYAMLLGLWQLSHPTEKINKVLMSPSLQILRPEFSTSARQSLQQLWQATLLNSKPEKGGIWKKLFS